MHKQMLTGLLAAVLLSAPGSYCRADHPGLRFFGHACFLLTTSQGTTILMDPVNIGSYKVPQDLIPQAITVSHNHGDHNAVGTVSGHPVVIYGTDPKGRQPHQEFLPIDTTIRDVRITNVSSNHFPPAQSPQLNSIFIFEFDGIRLVHLGDLGILPDPEQIQEIGKVDILLIPVGGQYTLDPEKADETVALLNPKWVIPMHCKTGVVQFLPYSAEDFLKGKEDALRIAGEWTVDLQNPPKQKYIVLEIE